MPPAANDIIRVAARLNRTGVGDFVNVYSFRVFEPAGLTDAQLVIDMADAMDKLYTTIASRITSSATFADINVFNETQLRPLGVVPWPILTAGSNASEPLPYQVAAFVRGTTGLSRNWARKFLGPFTETDNNVSGFVNTSLMTPLANFAAEWLVSTVVGFGIHYEPVVFYSKLGLWQTITATVLTNVWATLRRRRAGRGS